MGDLDRAREETLPALRAEAGLPPEDQDDEGGYDEERTAYVEVLENTIVGMKMALNMRR
jgi:hypothetical protein